MACSRAFCDPPHNGGPLFPSGPPHSPIPYSPGGTAPGVGAPCTACTPGQCCPGAGTPIGGGGSQSFCQCLGADTLVPVYQGKPKRAGNVALGERLVSAEGCPEVVVATSTHLQPGLRISWDGGQIDVSLSHHFLAEGGSEVVAQSLSIGESILGDDSLPRTITAIEELGELEVVAFSCQPSHVFQAAGLLHHNKATLIPYPQAML